MRQLRTKGQSITPLLRRGSVSLAEKYPYLKECYRATNLFDADEVPSCSNVEAAWNCLLDQSHPQFWARVCDRTNSYVHNSKFQCCPTCGAQPRSRTSQHVENYLQEEWCSNENGRVPASWVDQRSSTLALWLCSQGHYFRAKVSRRVKGQDCPICFEGEREDLRQYPDIIDFYDRSNKNDGYDYKSLPLHHRVCWRSASCPPEHSWYASLAQMKEYPLCRKCHPRHIDLRDNLLLLAEFDRRKNGSKDPCRLRKCQEIHWRCTVGPDHTWTASVESRFIRGDGCPFCSGRKLSETNNLLGHPELAAEWNTEKNGGLKPDLIKVNDRQRRWWSCSKCARDWQQSPYSRLQTGQRNCLNCRRNKLAVESPEEEAANQLGVRPSTQKKTVLETVAAMRRASTLRLVEPHEEFLKVQNGAPIIVLEQAECQQGSTEYAHSRANAEVVFARDLSRQSAREKNGRGPP